jgi:hypothetical protein
MWAFNIVKMAWKRLADAPPPSRGGPAIAYLDGALYRMNGFDGKTEQDGALDKYDLSHDSRTTVHFSPDSKAGSISRCVCALSAVSI